MKYLKKYTQKDRHGNMFSFEFDVPSLQEIPKPVTEETTNVTLKAIKEGIDPAGFKPKGTDTVPAMLTPGENIVNAEASRLPGVQPMLDKLNDAGRAIQKKQGGPIPSYNAEGGQIDYYGNKYGQSTVNAEISTLKGMGLSDAQIIQALMNNLNMSQGEAQAALMPAYKQEGGVITEDMMPSVLDAMRKVESGGNTNAVSEVGAAGPYQIMEATGLNPGYGVKAISGADRFDEVKSRAFAKQYLKGIMKAHPEFTKDEVITAYHSGAGNVIKAKGGVEDLGPRGKGYAGKVNEAMDKEIPLVTYDMTPMKSGMMSAQASTEDGVPKEDKPFLSFLVGDKYEKAKERRKRNKELYGDDVVLDSLGNVQSVNPNRINPEIPKTLEERLKNKQITQEQFDNQMNAYDKAVKQDDAANAEKTVEGLGVSTVGDDSSDDAASLYAQDLKKKSAQSITDQLNNEEDIDQTVMNDEEIASFIKDNPQLDAGDGLIAKAKRVGGPIVDKSIQYFKDAFASMFDGEELARMALIYAGSRVMGYDHGSSLDYSMKNYIKRVDANQAYAKKAVLDKDFADRYTASSLAKYAKSADVDDLIPKAKTLNLQTVSGNVYIPGYGKATTFKGDDKIEYVQIDGRRYAVSDIKGVEKFDEKVHGDATVAKRYNEFGKNYAKYINDQNNYEKGDDGYVAYEPIGSQANDIYRKILRQNGVSINDAPKMQMAVERAIGKFIQARSDYKSKKTTIKPNNLRSFVNMEVFTPLTGIKQAYISGTSPENLAKIDNMIKKDMKNKNPRSSEYIKEYYNDWQGTLEAYKKVPKAEREVLIKEAAEKSKGGNKWSAFTLWVSRTSPDKIEELAKQ